MQISPECLGNVAYRTDMLFRAGYRLILLLTRWRILNAVAKQLPKYNSPPALARRETSNALTRKRRGPLRHHDIARPLRRTQILSRNGLSVARASVADAGAWLSVSPTLNMRTLASGNMMTLAAIHLHLTSYPAPTSLAAIDYACALAKFFEARLNVSSSKLIVQTPRNWMVAGAMSKMAREIEAITAARTDALELHVQREAMLLGLETRISHAQEFWPGGLVDNAWRGRVGDLCVLGLAPDGGASRLYVEDWLFGAGRPCLLYPDTSEQAFAIDNILICWDFSKSAARTVSDGLPLLHNAKRIRVAVFRGEKGIAIDDPATPLVVFLADHGIVVESEDVLVGKRTIGQAIVDHARATDTHLIMTGAFGHSRLQEFVLGGATRELLNTSTIPLLMSH